MPFHTPITRFRFLNSDFTRCSQSRGAENIGNSVEDDDVTVFALSPEVFFLVSGYIFSSVGPGKNWPQDRNDLISEIIYCINIAFSLEKIDLKTITSSRRGGKENIWKL